MNRQNVRNKLHMTENVDFDCEQEHTSNFNAVLDIYEDNSSAHDECPKCTSNDCSVASYCFPRTLEELYLRESILFGNIFEMRVNANSLMKKIDLSNNHLMEWSGPMMNVKLEYMDLSNNSCEIVHKEFFRNQSKMMTLLLDGNLIGLNIEHHADGQLFNDLRNLSELRFSQNRLKTLPLKLFTGWYNCIH